jgi:hypothetical protein
MEGRQLKALELGARIQYFTIEHLVQAGIYADMTRAWTRKHMRDLKAYGWLSESHYGISRGFGRLPALMGITPKASRYLIEYEGWKPERIKMSKSERNQEYETRAPADYFHRVGVLDSVLSLLLMLDREDIIEDHLELYFRRFGMHQPRRTAIELEDGRIEPDAILSFTREGKPHLYLIEFYEDPTDMARVKRSLLRHREALRTGAPSEAFGLAVGHRVLAIFRHEHMARKTMEWVRETPELASFADRYLFKTRESIIKDPLDHWGTAKTGRVTVY